MNPVALRRSISAIILTFSPTRLNVGNLAKGKTSFARIGLREKQKGSTESSLLIWIKSPHRCPVQGNSPKLRGQEAMSPEAETLWTFNGNDKLSRFSKTTNTILVLSRQRGGTSHYVLYVHQ